MPSCRRDFLFVGDFLVGGEGSGGVGEAPARAQAALADFPLASCHFGDFLSRSVDLWIRSVRCEELPPKP